MANKKRPPKSERPRYASPDVLPVNYPECVSFAHPPRETPGNRVSHGKIGAEDTGPHNRRLMHFLRFIFDGQPEDTDGTLIPLESRDVDLVEAAKEAGERRRRRERAGSVELVARA